jgi:hypothetical protein
MLTMLAGAPAREQVLAYARGFSWAQTSQAQLELFGRLAGAAAKVPA